MPRTKLVINLCPANVRKAGTAFDLPIAIGILIASGQIEDLGKLEDYWITGEIGLDGTIHPVAGVLCMAWQAKKEGWKGIVVPYANAEEAALIPGINVYPVRHLREVISFIKADCSLEPFQHHAGFFSFRHAEPDFKDVKGQHRIKRAMEIAAAGGHHSLIIGPPGVGKTMLASRLPSILPPMTRQESLETTRIYSVLPEPERPVGIVTSRPFRNPHHTVSNVALIGGGTFPIPGEISKAHNGVLFLDELPEFRRSAIEVLRQPLEERRVLISRASQAVKFPASFLLVASMNPCLCGYYNQPGHKCTCSQRSIYWYRRKISSPLLDRFDLHIKAEPVELEDLLDGETGETSASIRKRVIKARDLQTSRYQEQSHIFCNAQMKDEDVKKVCIMEPYAKRYLLKIMEDFSSSARSYIRILKISRTIADLADSSLIELKHVAEAIYFRGLDQPLASERQKPKRTALNHYLLPVKNYDNV
jgi:magnesium chelatase family protein